MDDKTKLNSKNIVQKENKHANASFVRPKNFKSLEYLKEKEQLEEIIEKKIEEVETGKITNKSIFDTSIIPSISLEEFNKIKKENKKNLLNELNKADLEKSGLTVRKERPIVKPSEVKNNPINNDLNKTMVIPTISLEEYNKSSKPQKVSFLKKLLNLFKKKEKPLKISKVKEPIKKNNLEPKKKEHDKNKLLKEEKKKKLIEQKQKELERKKQRELEKAEQKKKILEEKNKKLLEKRSKKALPLKKEVKESSVLSDANFVKNEQKKLKDVELVAKKQKELELKKQKELEKAEQKKKILEEKNKIKLKKEEERKEKIRLKVEEDAKRQKEKEDKLILLQSERKEKEAKIKKEKEEARRQRKEKLKLIKKAQEESKAKEKNERKSLQEKLTDWYNNLSFVRDTKNRRELQRQTLLIDFEGSDAVRSEEKIMYKYVAKNNETGKVETGYFAAFSKLDVHSFLIAEGFEVYEITPQKNFAKSLTFLTPKFKSTELDFFLTQLSTFLRSGITLIDSVKILSKQSKKKSQKNVYKSIIYELSMGENFSEALAKQGTIFPRLLINMIKTSELTGDLPETLDDMANYYREIEKTKKQMISAITYPAVVLVFAFTILIFIMVSVIPQFVGIYKDLGTDLPKITIVIINLSSFLQANWVYVVIGIVAFIIIFIALFKSIKVFKTVIQSMIMNMPVFGKIIIYNEVTMFTKTFASLLNHNVYITDCMEVLSKITNNEIYKMLIFDTITNLAKGEAISNSFKNHWAFPTIAYEMILTGEKTGQLGNMMDKVADYYQELHKNAVNQIKAFIEPVMIVILAGIVGTVLLSVILPMFDMYQNIG